MAIKKRGLGKGLSALIPDEPLTDLIMEEGKYEKVKNISIKSISPNREQPRINFDEESLSELTGSIEQYGVIQPIVVRKKGEEYEIIAGERRWRAAKAAKLKEIPCIVKDISDKEAMKVALIENLQRDDLNPIEEAYAFKGLIEEHKLTQEQLALAINKSRSYISNSIRLLNLDEEIVGFIAKGDLSSGHGRALLGIKNKDDRLKAAVSIKENKINVRDTEKLVKKRKATKKTMERNPFITEIEEELMRTLGTKVNLSTNKNGGTISIEFYGHEDLERILDLLTGQGI